MKKYYTAFGLGFESGVDLPELLPGPARPDVRITFGKTPGRLEAPLVRTPWHEAAQGRFLLRVHGIAAYYVEDGSLIVVEPHPAAQPEDVRVFLLHTVLAALLHQRDWLVLHGAAVIVDDRAVAFVGPSQVGKSTIAFTLYERGYHLIDDEICAIRIQDGTPAVFPGIPQLHVWRDTLMKAEKDIHRYKPVRRGIEKYAFPVCERFGQAPAALGNIVFLHHHNAETPVKGPVKGGAGFDGLLRNAYCVETVADRTRHFRIGAAVTGNALLQQVTFNGRLDSAGRLTDFILKELR